MGVFVVTGARGGIGLEYIRTLSSEPANTVVALVRNLNADLSELRTIEAQSAGRVHILECDVSSPDSTSLLSARLLEALGPDVQVSTLINNAAVLHSRHETSLDLSAEALQSHMASNVIGPAQVLQALLPRLAPGAVVANITSGIGSLTMLSDGRIDAEITPYSISKAALNMLTVHQARHLKGKAIVVCVDPGHVKTEMGGPKAVVERADSAQGVLATLAALKPEESGRFLLYNGTELPW